ncbi:MAG: T9SS type A sorting domain-containing protein, partial [Bacteroidales bacterium]|nr:T9SS type A sorting domain-containing protein [Bacteroidales bacterium]
CLLYTDYAIKQYNNKQENSHKMKPFCFFIASLIFISINTFSQKTNSFENALDFLVDVGDSVIYSLDGNVSLYANVISITEEKIIRFDWDINGDNVIDTTTTSQNDYLTLTLPTDNNEIKILDLQGKLLLQQNVGFSAEVNVSMLSVGTYVLVVNGESYKFVKE